LAGTSDMNIVFSNMGIYYANAINAVFLNHWLLKREKSQNRS
jgi:hypothetical protein